MCVSVNLIPFNRPENSNLTAITRNILMIFYFKKHLSQRMNFVSKILKYQQKGHRS